MQLDEERLGPIVVLAPRSGMDATELPGFDARLRALIEDGVRFVVWDLSGLRILPSTAAGFLIQTGKRLHRSDGRLVLAGPSPSVRGMLKTMGISELFPQFADRTSAVAALRSEDERE